MKRRLLRGRAGRQPGPVELIGSIDIRPLAILLALLVAMATLVGRHPTHATLISLSDGLGDHLLLADNNPDPSINDSVADIRLVLTEDMRILWDDESISQSTLVALLQEIQVSPTLPVLEFEPQAQAAYGLTAKLIHVLNESGVPYRIAGMGEHCRFDYRPGTNVLVSNETSLSIAVTVFVDSDDDLLRQEIPRGDDPCEPRFAIQS